MTIPLQTMRKIVKKETGLRCGTDTAQELVQQLEEQATLISNTAAKIATHAGRITILPEDILLAIEILQEE